MKFKGNTKTSARVRKRSCEEVEKRKDVRKIG